MGLSFELNRYQGVSCIKSNLYCGIIYIFFTIYIIETAKATHKEGLTCHTMKNFKIKGFFSFFFRSVSLSFLFLFQTKTFFERKVSIERMDFLTDVFRVYLLSCMSHVKCLLFACTFVSGLRECRVSRPFGKRNNEKHAFAHLFPPS